MRTLLLILLFSGTAHAAIIDTYANFQELSAAQAEGRDFTVTVNDRGSRFGVFAIHGGKIEPITSELAVAVAGEDLNLYRFEGIKADGNLALHITSAHFDEPRALALAAKTETCVSTHSYLSEEKAICVGGANVPLMEKIARALQAQDFTVVYPCVKFAAKSRQNIVNRCALHGAQLEISTALADELAVDHSRFDRLASLLRSVLK